MVLHAIAFVGLGIVLWISRTRERSVVLRRAAATGFGFYFLFWLLFCWSEWHPEYGAPQLLMALFFSALVGLLGAVAFGLLGAACLWAYRRIAGGR
jgi:hypothetical protein